MKWDTGNRVKNVTWLTGNGVHVEVEEGEKRKRRREEGVQADTVNLVDDTK